MRFTTARSFSCICLKTGPSESWSVTQIARTEHSWREAYLLDWSEIQNKQEEGGSEQEQLVIKSPYLVQCTKTPDDFMDQELSGAGKCISDPWQKPVSAQFCRVASEGQEEDSLLFTFLMLPQHDYYPRICSKDIRKSLDKEQYLCQEWWNLPVEKSDQVWSQTSLPSLLVLFSESFLLELAAHLYSRHALPAWIIHF